MIQETNHMPFFYFTSLLVRIRRDVIAAFVAA